MAGEEHADHLTAPHVIACLDHGIHRFEARQHPTGMLDRQHRPVDHEAGEVHHAVGRRPNRDARRRADVDAAMAAPVRGGRRDIGPDDRVRRGDRPRPATVGARRVGCEGRGD
jgi:hypothetical protein